MNEKLEEQAINPNNGNENKTNTFNLIIGIATLLIAILGATFAYFSATARSKENDVTVQSAYVSISYDGGTEIKASNLIPATEQVALKKYQKEVTPFDPDLDGEIKDDYDLYKNDIERKCVDAKGKEVCYVYQFSIQSDGEAEQTTEILASIKVNKNEFTNLSYVLYEVTFDTDPETSKAKTDKYGFGIVKTYTVVSSFKNKDEHEDNEDYQDVLFAKFPKPYDERGDSDELTQTVYPVACLFGEEDVIEDKKADDTSRCKPYQLTNQEKHTYQLVIWLEETGEIQEEQGKTFEGTVSIEVNGGMGTDEYTDGKITGEA